MNGFSRIGSFLFGQGVPELAAEDHTRMVCSDSDDDGPLLAPGSERVHVDGDFNVSVVPRDVLETPDASISPPRGGFHIRATPSTQPPCYPDTPRPSSRLFPDALPAHRFCSPRLSDPATSSDSITVNTSGGNVTSPAPGKYGSPFYTSSCEDSLGAAAAGRSTDVDARKTTPSGRTNPSPPHTPGAKRKVDWASTPIDDQVHTEVIDYSPSPVPLRPILKRQTRVYGTPGNTPYPGAHWHDDTDSGYHNSPSSLSSTGNSNYSSFVKDFSLSPGGEGMHPVTRCAVKPKKFDGKNWSGYKLHFLSVAQANCWNQNEAARVLKSSLDDDVALMLRRRLRRGDATLEDVFAALDARFNVPGPDYVLRSKVRRTTQKPNQTVAQFQKELMRVLACRVDAEESPEALEQFVHGMIDPRMQKYVAKRQPEDIHEALVYAREFEETNAWMSSATRQVTKRIAMISLGNDEKVTPPPVPSNEQSAALSPESAKLIAELMKKVEALEIHNQEAAERSRLWKERRQQGFQKKWNSNGRDDRRNKPTQDGDAGRPAVRQVKAADAEDSIAGDAAESGET